MHGCFVQRHTTTTTEKGNAYILLKLNCIFSAKHWIFHVAATAAFKRLICHMSGVVYKVVKFSKISCHVVSLLLQVVSLLLQVVSLSFRC